jgi:very-short-patch-repair endonuclease
MLRYQHHLKNRARTLRKNMTDSERVLWSRLRAKQVFGGQVYRQKPLGEYIVDFFIPKAKLVIDVDGSQHSASENAEKDRKRDAYMKGTGLQMVRFKRSAVLKETDAVVDVIARAVRNRLNFCADPLVGKLSSGT